MLFRPILPGRHPSDREILRLAVPALGALAAEPLYVLTDTAVVGHLGTPQLGGLAVAGTILTRPSRCSTSCPTAPRRRWPGRPGRAGRSRPEYSGKGTPV